MGCDIHMYVEYLKNDKWWNGDDWRVNAYYDPSNPEGESEMDCHHIWRNRDYDLFAILADVRNYGETEYIDDPRGVPDDMSPQVAKDYERWGLDAHSASWFTLWELRNFAKHHPGVKQAGLISPAEKIKLDEGQLPESWCQGTNQENYVRAEWVRPGSPLDDLIDLLDARMRELFWLYGKEKEHVEYQKKFRIVFWFDN